MSLGAGHPVAAFFGRLLVWIGLIIAVLSGGCTLLVGGFLVVDELGRANNQLWEAIFLPVSFGVLPFLFGLACFWAGRRLVRWGGR